MTALTVSPWAATLTPREQDVIRALLRSGWANAAVAEDLVISVKTVDAHLAHIYDKLRIDPPARRPKLAFYLGQRMSLSETEIVFAGLETVS